jgi:WD40 repeat protein
MRYVLRPLCIIISAVCLLYPVARLLGSQRTDGQIVYRAEFGAAERPYRIHILDIHTTIDLALPHALEGRGFSAGALTLPPPTNAAADHTYTVVATTPPTSRKDPFLLLGIRDSCCPIWSADGATMTYIRDNSQVVILDLTTHEERSLAGSTSLAWSPDGRWLLYLSAAAAGKSVMIVSSDGAQRHQIASFDTACSNPQWSPLGNQLALVCYTGGHVDVFVAHSACGFMPTCEVVLNQITHSTESEGTPRWSPDGQWVVYSRHDDRTRPQVYATHIVTGEQRRLTYAAPISYAPRWTLLYAP